MYQWSHKMDRILVTKVNSDLTVAQQYLDNILARMGERIEMLARSEELAETENLDTLLDRYRERLGLDYLYIRLPGGRIAAASPRGAAPVDSPDSVPPHVVKNDIEILTRRQLQALSPELASKAEIALYPTHGTSREGGRAETRGMVAQSSVPVSLPHGESKAVMVGGMLLNRDPSIIATINDLIYRPGTLPAGSHGTTSLFLDDLRISTNVMLPGGESALGTRASAEVREKVLGQGRTWLDRAKVLDDWYVSAYSPISDNDGKRIGMLYVGILDHPFTEAKRRTVLEVLLAFLIVAVVTIPIFLRWAGGIFRPLEKVNRTIAQVRGGNLAARTGVTEGADEVAGVAILLDDLLSRLQHRDRQLRRWNDELNNRVEERTAELRQAAQELENATHQLVQSEKLAVLGEISASVAHEINNPLAVIQGNLDIIREILGERAAPAEEELRLLDEQTYRISHIVTRLLNFARVDDPEEGEPHTDPAVVISECDPLVRHMLARASVHIHRDMKSTHSVRISRMALQQVLINLIVNAVHAMPGGGDIHVASRDEDRANIAGVVLSVSDTGRGVSADLEERIFSPFLTTRGNAGGTGLGLSICRRLIERQGGSITLESPPGEGACFVIWLPAT